MAMTRSEIESLMLVYLATSSDDPLYPAATLHLLVQQGVDSLLHDIQEQNPDYLSKTTTLVADSTTSHNYTFATQTSAITDFAKWIEVRYTDEDGLPLQEAKRDELRDAGSDFFVLTGPDDTPVLITSADSPAGTDLYFAYGYWPAALSGDSSQPTGIPGRYHDVVALEAVVLSFGLGGEQRMPAELGGRWRDRRGQLMARIARRGTMATRSRITNLDDF